MTENIKPLSKNDWLNLIPCKLYNKQENKSYLIIAVSNEGLYYEDTFEYLNDDDFGFSPYSKINVQKLISFKKLNENFIIGDEPTEKQINWLKKYNLMTNSMTKQEAWQIINKYVEENKHKARSRYVSHVLDSMFNAEEIIGQCGGMFDDGYY